MNRCPYCGEEIPENVLKCPECNELLVTKQRIKLGKNLLIKIGCAILTILFITVTVLLCWKYEDESIKTMISSIRVLPSEYSNGTYYYDDVYDVFVQTAREEGYLDKYLSNLHLPQNKDKAFLTYYNKLEASCGLLNFVNYSQYDFMDTISAFNGILNKGNSYEFGSSYKSALHVIPIMLDKSEYPDSVNRIKTLKITKPQTPFIKMSYGGEGYFVAEVNYEYLNKKYSKYLSPALKDYLAIRQKEEKDMNYHTYYIDGAVGVSRTVLTDWIIAWQNFRKKYPKFKPDEMDRILNLYTSDFISSTYTTFDYINNNLLPEAKKDYEVFLKKVDPKSDEYKAVEKCYSVLKAHNYKETNEFYVCRDEWRNKYSEY